MTEGAIFLVELALVVGVGILGVLAGGSVSGSMAAGLYGLVTGVLLLVVPMLAWEVARTDNAFLGLYLIGLLAVLFGAFMTVRAALRLRGQPSRGGIPTAVTAAVVTAGLAAVLLVVRGPDVWRTGSGQFGLDVIVADVVLALAAYLMAVRLRSGESRRRV
jgi:hypothetical protein